MLQVPPSGTPTPSGVLSSTTLPTLPIRALRPPLTVTANHNRRPMSMMIHKSLPLPPGETPVPNPAGRCLPPHSFQTMVNPNRTGPSYPLETSTLNNLACQTPSSDTTGDGSSFGSVTTQPVVQLDSPPLGAQKALGGTVAWVYGTDKVVGRPSPISS